MSPFKKLCNSIPLHKKVIFAVLGVMVAHSTVVEGMRMKRRIEPEFGAGSADEQLAESLGPGDIVLFNRKAYMYHLPVALLILAQKHIYDSEFDHAGVIMMDLGIPYLVEHTPFGGIKYRPFSDRIRHSTASHIVVIPPEMVNDFDEAQKRNLKKVVVEELSKQNIFQGSEFFKFISTTLENVGKDQPHYCIHSQLIRKLWNSLGYEVTTKKQDSVDSGKVTIKSFHDRDVVFKGQVDGRTGIVKLASNDVMIRSS